MRILSAASAFPNHVYEQQAITATLEKFWGQHLEQPKLLHRLHGRTGVARRHLALPLESYAEIDTWGKANSVWIEEAERLGAAAICRAITPLGLRPRDVDTLFFTSVTGIASPSIDARLINRIGLSPNLKRMPLFGLGCVAGAAGIARAADYVRAFPGQVAVVLAVELCSLTWQREDFSTANFIATGLFGDGAAAVVVGGEESEFPGPAVVATRSVFYPNTEDVMGWDISEHGFRIVLSREVPVMVERHLRGDVDSFLAAQGLGREDIASWIIHTGGPNVLEAVARTLELPEGALDASWECLQKVGNLSSASVLIVLQDFLSRRRGAPGSYSLMAAMGPGFCSELVLLRW